MSDCTEQAERDILKSYVGKNAVYRGTGFLIPSTVKEMAFYDNHVEATLVAHNGIILRESTRLPKPPDVFTIGSAHGYSTITPNLWSFSFPGCCWSLIIQDSAFTAVVRLCEKEQNVEPARLFELADFVLNDPGIQRILVREVQRT